MYQASGPVYSFSHRVRVYLSVSTEWIMLLSASPLHLCSWQRLVCICPSLHPFSCPSKIKHGAKLCQQNKLGHFAIHAAAFAGAKKAMEVILKAGMERKNILMIRHRKLKVRMILKRLSQGQTAHLADNKNAHLSPRDVRGKVFMLLSARCHRLTVCLRTVGGLLSKLCVVWERFSHSTKYLWYFWLLCKGADQHSHSCAAAKFRQIARHEFAWLLIPSFLYLYMYKAKNGGWPEINKNEQSWTSYDSCQLLNHNGLFTALLAGEELGRSAECHINYLDKSKSSPLHLAVRGGNIDVIRLCIAIGAKVDQQQVPTSQSLHLHHDSTTAHNLWPIKLSVKKARHSFGCQTPGCFTYHSASHSHKRFSTWETHLTSAAIHARILDLHCF